MCDSAAPIFDTEAKFESALIDYLVSECGWESKILKYPSAEDLIENWRQILSNNNLGIDVLNGQPLTSTEMDQIMDQVRAKNGSPYELNTFINGKSVCIKRDNPADPLHLGKEVSLHIYDRLEIAGGKSRYQIAQQPQFKPVNDVMPKRRGDVMLLINGMPCFHIELKNSSCNLSNAYNQIEEYSNEGIFSGIFSMVQIFVAMKPDDCLYFANPGPDVNVFDKRFFFHWADFNNTPVKNWKAFSSDFLRIPIAHQIIGFYTIPDSSDGVLKVLRSYQYHAINKIVNIVSKADWNSANQRGGVIWHTTGSGKTISSFKAADLIAQTKDADKVIFLVDRIDLDTQSKNSYIAFSPTQDYVQGAESTQILIQKLKNDNSHLIVASIQKMSRIKEDENRDNLAREADIRKINKKRLVFIVDECHRSTFGDMMDAIKTTFPRAIFFGFSGTPIKEENKKKGSTSTDVFGSDLHRYVIGEAIRDWNVLGFDPYMVSTFRDKDLRHEIGLEKAKASSIEEVLADSKKSKIYYKFQQLPMERTFLDANGNPKSGIEGYVPASQYETEEHQNAVVQDIIDRFDVISMGGRFHAIFATSSIKEAIEYYRIFKTLAPNLKTTTIIDPTEDNGPENYEKIQGLAEIVTDYSKRYGNVFTVSSYPLMKKDVLARLAHKGQYRGIERPEHKDDRLDLVIVVNQLLTGYDSKWINALYLDKLLYQESVIQAFSRTNRLCGEEKHFGMIFYYRYPHTMKKNVEDAIKLYSGDKAPLVYVSKLYENLQELNAHFEVIKLIFNRENIENFSRLPSDAAAKSKFAKEFNILNESLEKAKIQDFRWDKTTYSKPDDETQTITVAMTKEEYHILLRRYKDLCSGKGGDGDGDDTHYDISSHITEIETDKIDEDYMNSRFVKYLMVKRSSDDILRIQDALAEVSSSFAFLSEQEQKYAYMFIRDLQSGEVTPDGSKTFKQYIVDYMQRAQDDCISKFAAAFGINELDLRTLVMYGVDGMNEYGRKEKVVAQARAHISLVQAYFEKKKGTKVSEFKANTEFGKLLVSFVKEGGFEI